MLGVEITSAGVSRGLASSGGEYLYLKDALGSIQAITDGSGNILQRYVYSSFGKLLKITDNVGNEMPPLVKTSYAFTNRELDDETGLYYYRARYYDAHSGRFMQEDPHPGVQDNPLSLNSKYVYAGNNPNSYVDPEGSFIIELIVLTLVQTAFQSAMQNGSWWDNFRHSFDAPFSGRGNGQFWENLIFNGIAMGFGFNPGFDLKTGIYLSVSVIGADLQDQQEREGYNSNYLGFKVGQLYDVFKIYKAADRAWTIYTGWDNFKSWFQAWVPHQGRFR